MMHWLVLTALHLGAAQLQLGLREENRLGFISNAPSADSVQTGPGGTSTTIAAELKPFARLHLFAHGTEFLLTYQPQLLFTEAFGFYNTLLLNTANLTLAQRLTRSLSLATSASGTIGKIDFFRAQRLLQADTATVFTIPANTVLGYASGNAYAGLVKTIGRFSKFEIGGLALYNGPSPGEKTFLYFRRQTQAGATTRFSEQIGRNDTVAAELEYRKVWFDHGPYYGSYTPALIWRHLAASNYRLETKIGTMFSTTEWGDRQIPQWYIGEGLLPVRTGQDHRILPLFNISLSGFEIRRPGLDIQTTGTFNLLPYYDPVNGILQQRLGFGFNSQLIFSRIWRGKVNLQILSPAKWQYGHSQQPFINQDFYALLNAAVIRRITPITYMEVGTYVTQRLEDYTQVFGHWYQPQIIVYLAFQGQTTVW